MPSDDSEYTHFLMILLSFVEMYNVVALLIVDNRTMLPARFVAENLGADVKWLPETQEVVIRI